MLLLGGFFVVASWLTALSAVRSAGNLEAVASGSSSGDSSSSGSASQIKEYGKTASKQTTKTFADVCGCNEAREELRDVVEFLKHPGESVAGAGGEEAGLVRAQELARVWMRAVPQPVR